MNNWRDAVDAELDEPVEEHIWDFLTANGDAADLELELVSPKQLASRVQRIRAAVHRTDATAAGFVREPGQPYAGAAARARIDALSAIYAAWASLRHDVCHFRETILARTLATMAAFSVDTPSAEQSRRLAPDQVADWVRWCRDADSPDGDGNRYVRQLAAQTSADGRRRVATLRFVDGRQERAQTVAATGVLGKLASLADNLAGVYRWRQSEASMFVITEWIPEVFVYTGSAQIRYHELSATSRVTLTLDPLLSPEDVAAIYSRLRQRFHPAPLPRYQSARSARRYNLAGHVGPHVQICLDDPYSRNGPGRPPAPGPTGLASFVEPLPGYSWPGLWRSWNATHGDQVDDNGQNWHYDKLGNFIRDAKIALQRLLFPGWTSEIPVECQKWPVSDLSS